jgi:oxalate decarboxylase/phosphoglucose isomerase-like protein (cupin superfamily)
VFLEIFKTDTYQDISLSDWLTHTPRALVAAHFNLSREDIAKFPNHNSHCHACLNVETTTGNPGAGKQG